MSEQKPQFFLGMIGSAGHGKTTLSAAIGKVMQRRNPPSKQNTLKRYLARLRGSGELVGAFAENGTKAMQILEGKHGKGNVLLIRLLIRLADAGNIPRIPFLTEDDVAVK